MFNSLLTSLIVGIAIKLNLIGVVLFCASPHDGTIPEPPKAALEDRGRQTPRCLLPRRYAVCGRFPSGFS